MGNPCEWCVKTSEQIEGTEFQVELLEIENKTLRQEIHHLETEVAECVRLLKELKEA